MSVYKTTWEDDYGAEFDIKVQYDYYPDESVDITNVYILDYDDVDYDGTVGKNWSDAWDLTLDHHDKWAEDILESIRKEY